MSYLLEILGRGLLAELAAAFRDLLRGDGAGSSEELEAKLAGDARRIDHLSALAVRRLSDGQNGRARLLFEEALRLEPTDRTCRIGLACALDELGQTRDAAGQLRVARDQCPQDEETLFALGFCYEKLGETDAAMASYEAALDLAPQLRNAHERLAAMHLQSGHVDTAILHYEHICWCEPHDLAAAMTLATLYVCAARYEDAIHQYRHGITIDPDNWEVQDELVTACMKAGRFDDAIHTLHEMIEQRPDCASQHVQLGDAYTKTGQHRAALAAYARAVQLNPEYLEATVKTGAARLREGDYAAAAGDFNHAIELNDRAVSGYVGLGVALQALGRTEEALESLDMARSIEPNSTLLFSEMARLQLKVTNGQQINKYLSPHAMATAPAGPPDADASNLIHTQIARLRAALRDHPHHADWHYRLGLLLKGDGDLEGAINAFRSALSINPDYLKALSKLAVTLHEAGRSKEALGVLRRATEFDATAVGLHYQLGLLFADYGEFSLALDRFETALRHDPRNVDYLANVALALQNMGLINRADAGWQALVQATLQDAEESPIAEG